MIIIELPNYIIVLVLNNQEKYDIEKKYIYALMESLLSLTAKINNSIKKISSTVPADIK